jgi:hypothetical protein
MREEMDEYEKQYTVHRKESEHGDQTVHMSPVLLRKALAVLSDEQCEAFVQAVRSSAPPPPMSAEQAELLIRQTAACAEGSASVLRHAHNPGHSLTCPTDSKVLTACSWMRADCQSMQQRSDHPPHGERALYNGQVWGRYDRSLHALVVTTRTRTDRGDICNAEQDLCNVCSESSHRVLVQTRTSERIHRCNAEQPHCGRLCFHRANERRKQGGL